MDERFAEPTAADDGAAGPGAWGGESEAEASRGSWAEVPLLDSHVLNELAALGSAEDGFLAELLEQHQLEAPRLLTEFRRAILKRDPKSLRHAAHTLKGGGENIAAAAMADRARVVEGLGANGQTDPADNQLRELEDLYQRTALALAAWMQAA